MTNQDMPGESFWVPFVDVFSRSGYPEIGQNVTVGHGVHSGKKGIVRTVDGATAMVQIRTGDPVEWAKYDAETHRMLNEMRGSR